MEGALAPATQEEPGREQGLPDKPRALKAYVAVPLVLANRTMKYKGVRRCWSTTDNAAGLLAMRYEGLFQTLISASR